MNKKTLVYALALLFVAVSVGVITTAASGFGRGLFSQDEVEAKIAEKVSDGTMTQEQADNKLAHFKKKNAKHEEKMVSLAGFFGLSVEELQTEMDSSKNIKEIAEAQGISEDQLQEYHQAQILEHMQDKLQRMVDSGSLTQAEADEKLEKIESGDYADKWSRWNHGEGHKGFGSYQFSNSGHGTFGHWK